MQYPKEVRGFIQYEGVVYPFAFSRDSFILNLYPPTVAAQQNLNISFFLNSAKRVSDGPRWIESIKLYADTADGKKAIFSVPNRPAVYYGFLSFKVNWYVHYLSEADEVAFGGLAIYGGEINHFFNPSHAVNRAIASNEAGEKVINAHSVNVGYLPMGSYRIEKGVSAEINLSAFAAYSDLNVESQLEASSVIYTDFSSEVNAETLMAAFFNLKRFFQYTTYSLYVDIFEAKVYRIMGGRRRVFGRAFIRRADNQPGERDRGGRIINYDAIGNKAWHILVQIKRGLISIEHLPEHGPDNESFSYNRGLMVVANFEREFELIYGNNHSRSDDYKKALADAVFAIESLMKESTGKRRKYFRQIRAYLRSRDDSLEDRIAFALAECKPYLEGVVIRKDAYDEKAFEIGCSISSFRNAAAHCKVGYDLQAKLVYELRVLEMAMYAIRLKWLKLTTEDIAKAVDDLFSLRR